MRTLKEYSYLGVLKLRCQATSTRAMDIGRQAARLNQFDLYEDGFVKARVF